ncbi:MAG: hypothetical protein KJ077_10815 [Anaerolineae bacterium]|nr:hypothetical protein [Anaerolineae bacterium]
MDYATMKREEGIAARNYERTMQTLEQQVDRQAEELEKLREELRAAQEKVKLLEADLCLARTELVAAQTRIGSLEFWGQSYREVMEAHREKHQILSQVIRLGLTPERYHELREIVERG